MNKIGYDNFFRNGNGFYFTLPKDEPAIYTRLIERLKEDMMQSGLSPGNKTALGGYLAKKENEIRRALNEIFREDIGKWNAVIEKANEILADEKRADNLKAEITELNAEIEKLKQERAALENKFSNPQAREAFSLWEEIVKPYRNVQDSQLERNAVLSAGKVVAAVFGYSEDNKKERDNSQ